MRRRTHEFLSRRGREPNAAGGAVRFPYGVSAPGPHASGLRRLSARVTDGTEKLTLYRDVAGTGPVSSMATESGEDIILFVFGMIDMYTTKCNKSQRNLCKLLIK